MTLREVFTPLLAYILLVTRTSAGRERTSSEIRTAIVGRKTPLGKEPLGGFLGDQENLVKRHNLSVSEYENARFAVIAWTDEALVRYASATKNSELYEYWQRNPLQKELDNIAYAGEEFFERLNRLETGQKDVREIYYLCLSLGFRGSHYSDSPEALLELRRKYSQAIPIAPADTFELERKREHVTPQPYEIQPPPNRPRPKPVSLLWPSVAVVLVSALLLYVFWPSPPCGNSVLDPGEQCDIALAGQCPGGLPCQKNCTCAPIPQPNMAQIDNLVKGLECTQVSAQNENGVIILDGRVQSEDQKQQFVQNVRDVQNVKEVRSNLTLLEWPFCQVVQMLTPFRTQTESSEGSLSISLQHGCDQVSYSKEGLLSKVTSSQVYQDKDPIAIAVTSSKNLSYIYIDYYTADKKLVLHVAPNPKNDQKNFYPDATSFKPTGTNSLKIGEPFGQELITIITSPQPLFAKPRPDTLPDIPATKYLNGEDVKSYLRDLEQQLHTPSSTKDMTSSSAANISAAFCFITSKE